MLFEMYGENYDETVQAMTREEKQELQKSLAIKIENENVEDIKLRVAKLACGSIGSTVSPFSLMATPSPRIVCQEDTLENSTLPMNEYESNTNVLSVIDPVFVQKEMQLDSQEVSPSPKHTPRSKPRWMSAFPHSRQGTVFHFTYEASSKDEADIQTSTTRIPHTYTFKVSLTDSS